MIRDVIFSPPARADVVRAAQNYAEKVDELLGEAFIDTAIDVAHSLAENPKRYKKFALDFGKYY